MRRRLWNATDAGPSYSAVGTVDTDGGVATGPGLATAACFFSLPLSADLVTHLCSILTHGWSQSWPLMNSTEVAMKSPVVAYSSNTEKIMYQTRFVASALIVIVACVTACARRSYIVVRLIGRID